MATYVWYTTQVSKSGVALSDSVEVAVWVGNVQPPDPQNYDIIIATDANNDGLISPQEWGAFTGGGIGLNSGSAVALFDGSPTGAGTLYSSTPYVTGDTGLKNGLVKSFTPVNPGNLEVAPCFTPGTMIDTPHGPRRVETLRVGDLVNTMDHGAQPLVWTGRWTLSATRLARASRGGRCWCRRSTGC